MIALFLKVLAIAVLATLSGLFIYAAAYYASEWFPSK